MVLRFVAIELERRQRTVVPGQLPSRQMRCVSCWKLSTGRTASSTRLERNEGTRGDDDGALEAATVRHCPVHRVVGCAVDCVRTRCVLRVATVAHLCSQRRDGYIVLDRGVVGFGSGAILTLSVAVGVTWGFETWKRVKDSEERHDTAARGFRTMQSDLGNLFRQTGVPFLDTPERMVPSHIAQAIAVLDRCPFAEWQHELPEQSAFFAAASRFRTEWTYFTNAAENAAFACNLGIGLCDSEHGRTADAVAPRQSVLMFCLGVATGYPVDACVRQLGLQTVDRAILQQYLDTLYEESVLATMYQIFAEHREALLSENTALRSVLGVDELFGSVTHRYDRLSATSDEENGVARGVAQRH